MPQLVLPLFYEGMTCITAELSVSKEKDRITYFHGMLPVFVHAADDVQTFHMITSQFCCNGMAKQADIVRAFGVTPISVLRNVKRYRVHGARGFYATRKSRGPAVLTPSVVAEAQALLDEGDTVAVVAGKLNLKGNTLSKAVRAGRLRVSSKKDPTVDPIEQVGACKSERSVEDSKAPMGVGATNVGGRVAASLGRLTSVDVNFQLARDVPNAGVLFALPALLAVGLLRHTDKHFKLPKGYYGLESLFLLLAFMALARLKTAEALRFCAPGEWGKVLGLDRIPEVRTLRGKIHHLTQTDDPTRWSADLCKDWLETDGALAFYVDGHVRVYHGDKARLPRHHVARQKLCLRATADYWVNILGGQPLFVVSQDVDPGLIQVLQGQIIPRLIADVPNQPTQYDMDEKGRPLHRFTVVFDREGYSPKLIRDLKEQRIACLTYHKYPGEDWPESEFADRRVVLASGQHVEMKLAERAVELGGEVMVREIRKLTESGHQTSILATDHISDAATLAAAMFARWCQENFFKYMREEYNLDRLIAYSVEEIPDSTRVVNPAHRELDGKVRKNAALLTRKRALAQAIDLSQVSDHEKLALLQQRHGELLEDVRILAEATAILKDTRAKTPKHITVGELPPEQRFSRLGSQSKHFVDTIKMVAYRAESAMANGLRGSMSRPEEARALLQAIYSNEADLVPNEQDQTLTVRLHRLANRSTDNAICDLCAELNETETVFPGTDLRMVYELVT